MQIQHIEDSQSEQILPQDFEQANALIDSIQPKESNPTKSKVKVFKNRVFHLLKIYVEKSSNVNQFIECMKQEMFIREPQKMKEIVNIIMNKQNIKYQNLQHLLNYYQVILLYKNHKKSSSENNDASLNFVIIFKKIAQINEQQAYQSAQKMLKSFAMERKCTLKIHFFFYLFRKYTSPKLKSLLIQDCEGYLQDQKLRNAQKKQLSKLLKKLDKNNSFIIKKKKNLVKKEQQSHEEDIVQVVQNDGEAKKQEESQVENKVKKQNKNQRTQEKLEKLQRIKANKKKRNNPKQNHQKSQKKQNNNQIKQNQKHQSNQNKSFKDPQKNNSLEKPRNNKFLEKPQHFSRDNKFNQSKPNTPKNNRPQGNQQKSQSKFNKFNKSHKK